VVSDGVWQMAQPMALKEPAAISDRGCSSGEEVEGVGCVQELHEDSEQRGITGDAGGAGTIGVRDVLGVADRARFRQLPGSPLPKWSSPGSGRSCVNSSLEMPISTL